LALFFPPFFYFTGPNPNFQIGLVFGGKVTIIPTTANADISIIATRPVISSGDTFTSDLLFLNLIGKLFIAYPAKNY
jgi:hypothetical protein